MLEIILTIMSMISSIASIICVIYSIHNDKQDKKFYSEIRDHIEKIEKQQMINDLYKTSDGE